MATVEDLAVEREIEAVEENAQLHGWPFERVGPRRFRVTLTAHNGDIYEVEVECDRFPVQPAAFHWRSQETGRTDEPADSPGAVRLLPFHRSHLRTLEPSRFDGRRASPRVGSG